MVIPRPTSHESEFVTLFDEIGKKSTLYWVTDLSDLVVNGTANSEIACRSILPFKALKYLAWERRNGLFLCDSHGPCFFSIFNRVFYENAIIHVSVNLYVSIPVNMKFPCELSIFNWVFEQEYNWSFELLFMWDLATMEIIHVIW